MKRLFFPLLLLLAVQVAPAQETNRILVGFGPGGTLDVLGRAVAQVLTEDTKQTVIVENQAGAGSLIAAQTVARAKPDGHTLLLAPVVVSAFMPHIYRNLTFDPLADLLHKPSTWAPSTSRWSSVPRCR